MLQTINYLTAFSQIPEAVVITVESNNMKRYLETCTKTSNDKGLGELNNKFIFDELIPLAAKNYHTNNFELLIGHSRYAYFTTYLLTENLTTLNGVISVSPFYVQPNVNLAHTLVGNLQKTQLTNSVYYHFATGDSVPDTQDYTIMHDALTKAILPANFNYKGYEYYSADHYATPGLTVGNALYSIFSQWANAAAVFYRDTTTTPEAEKYTKAINSINNYGADLPFSLATINGKGWQYYNNGNKLKAIEVWDLGAKLYPNFSEFYLFMAMAAKESGLPYKTYTTKFKSTIPSSSYYTKADKKELLKECKELER